MGRTAGLISTFLLVSLQAGCIAGDHLPAPGWNVIPRISTNVSDAPALAIGDAGQVIVVSSIRDAAGTHIAYVEPGAESGRASPRTLGLSVEAPELIGIYPADGGWLLLWLEVDSPAKQLNAALINHDLSVERGPMRVAEGVSSYTAHVEGNGWTILWSGTGPEPWLSAVQLDRQARPVKERRLGGNVMLPVVAVGSDARHLAWIAQAPESQWEMRYLAYHDKYPDPVMGTAICGPWQWDRWPIDLQIGLTHEGVYIFATVESMNGDMAGELRLIMAYFPSGSAAEARCGQLTMPNPSHNPTYIPIDTGLNSGHLAPWPESTDVPVGTVAVAPGEHITLPIALAGARSPMASGLLAVTYLRDGEPLGYQWITSNSGRSITLTTDRANYLHLAWNGQSSIYGWDVGYATTRPLN